MNGQGDQNGRTILPRGTAITRSEGPGISGRNLYLQLDPSHRRILVSSGRRGEGKSFVTAGMGISLTEDAGLSAGAPCRVLLIDGNLRAPTLHQLFGTHCRNGLVEVLDGSVEGTSAVQAVRSNLALLPAGSFSGGGSRRIDPEKLRRLLEKLGAMFDRIVIDSASALEYPDAEQIAPIVDACYLVAETGVTPVCDLREARSIIQEGGGKVGGIVMNRSCNFFSPGPRSGTESVIEGQVGRGDMNVLEILPRRNSL